MIPSTFWKKESFSAADEHTSWLLFLPFFAFSFIFMYWILHLEAIRNNKNNNNSNNNNSSSSKDLLGMITGPHVLGGILSTEPYFSVTAVLQDKGYSPQFRN